MSFTLNNVYAQWELDEWREANMARGYAVRDGDVLLVDTVSSTERAAKTNWLVTRARVMVCVWHTDQDVERMFDQHRSRLTFVVPVTVETAH